MSYLIRLERPGVKALDRVDRPTEQRLRECIRQLEANPFDPRISKRLHNLPGRRSARVRGWRIIYLPDKTTRTVHVLVIEMCGQVYK